MTSLAFDNSLAWMIGLPLAGVVLVLSGFCYRRLGCHWRQTATLVGLRAVALLILVMLVARPMWVTPEEELPKRDQVVLLVDRSESMSLADASSSRYHAAVEFARTGLMPALHDADLRVELMMFAEDAEVADGARIAGTAPDGKRTNLARAVARSLIESERPPLAVMALTDGATTDEADNPRAIATLVENRVPFVGIGFGDETATRVLSLEHVVAPPVVSSEQEFLVSARLRVTGAEELPPFGLVLLRDGQFVEQKTVTAGTGARVWQESFETTEPEDGLYEYTIKLLPPADESIKCPNTESTVSVRIAGEKDLRVLYVQGGLTWDYKFVRLAVQSDPTVKLTGLSRTTSKSAFFQYVDNADDVSGGFPTTMDHLASFRVVVLSNLRPTDLTPNQQDLLARFCHELGGGVLMIGGPDTFDASWQRSRLEQLLPVRFGASSGARSAGAPFHFRLTEDALAHPVFQISDAGDNRMAWSRLPTFTHYAPVDSAKRGARIWAFHSSRGQSTLGPTLMASQRYGAGLSAAICVQNLWRWRLAKESETQHFDRFWQQLLRHLGEGSRDDVTLRVPDQPLEPGADIRMVLEKRRTPGGGQAAKETYRFRVTGEDERALTDQTIELEPGQSVELTFVVEKSGIYRASVLDEQQNIVAARSLEIKAVHREFVYTARNMETLRSWAAISDGIAIRSEECDDPGQLLDEIKKRAAEPDRRPAIRRPAGINGWMLAVLVGCLGTEWLLRKRWGMR